MIAKGQLVETGLLAGNEADKAFKVDVNAFEVLVKEERGANDPLTNALTSDAIVDAPQLERARIFLFDVSPFIVQSGTGESFSLSSNLTLFAARNTFFRTPTIDLAEFQPTQSFLFVSLQNFVVEQSVHILDTTSPIAFLAGGTFDFAPDVSLSTSAPAVFIFTIGGGLSADVAAGGTLTTGSGELVLTGHSSFISNDQSGGLLFVSVPALTLNDGAYLASNGDLTVSTAGDVNITGRVSFLQGAISATTGLFAANTLDVQAQGNVKLTDTFIQATSTTIVSQKDFNAANVVFDYGSSLSSSSTRLAATNLMSLNNTVFFTQDVSLQARTIALSNVQFAQGSSVTLRSQSGQLAPNPNTNQPVRLGDVNFIHNVQYGKAPAQNAVRGGSIVITK
jgi:hypothetical protein